MIHLLKKARKTEAEGEPMAAVEEYARGQEKIFPHSSSGRRTDA